MQIEARIDQNAQLSDNLLWNQQAHVRRGSLIVIPVGRALLYAEPIYRKRAGRAGSDRRARWDKLAADRISAPWPACSATPSSLSPTVAQAPAPAADTSSRRAHIATCRLAAARPTPTRSSPGPPGITADINA
jgi:hypothetical protein